MKLTDKQLTFCEEYIKDYNASQAAIRAGYSPNGIKTSGPRLLANVGIANKIKELQNKEAKKHHITKSLLLDKLMDIVQKMTQGENEESPRAARVAIASIETINKMLGFNQQEESNEKHIVALQVNVKTND